jgi:1,4-dihydroxy-2-naphthoate octaprenyltransferase
MIQRKQSLVHPKLLAFVRLARLKFLIGGFSGGALGTAIAAYEMRSIDWAAYALAQVAITGAHLMTQFANEYYDRESDALTTRTPYSGGSGVLVAGELAPIVALRAALACLVVSACGIFALLATGHVLAASLGIAIIAFAWAYSAPPIRLLARGLGELDTVFVVAILVPLCAFAAQTDALDLRAFASTLPGALAMFVMMLCVQLPDVAADAATGKRNLVVRLGTPRIMRLARFSLVAFFAVIVISRLLGSPVAFVVIELVASVQIYWLTRAFIASDSGAPATMRALAERGVIFFGSVSIVGALGYVLALGTLATR